jgi:quercetin dioxygenase-like cupin family protein
MIVGPGGLEDRKDVWVGLSLLAPDVRYPDHQHAPEEIYLVLTDGQFRQGEGEWFTPGVGGTLYNKPNILHAMASSANTPLLAVWCLFDKRHQ